MITFRTLGGVELSDSDNGRTFSVLAHPKRVALLSYLAQASPNGFCRRDSLLAMFWPELDERRARRALNQALYGLRQELGDEAVVSRGQDEVGIAEGVLWSDVVAFRKAIGSSSWTEALDLYRGDLMPGFHLSGSNDFEDWLQRERFSLRELAGEAAWAAANAFAEQGLHVEAAKLARRAATYVDSDEVVLRRLLTFLSDLGDRAGSLAAYAAFAERLQRDYGAEPAPETTEVVSAIRATVAESVRRGPPRSSSQSDGEGVIVKPAADGRSHYPDPAIVGVPAPTRVSGRDRATAGSPRTRALIGMSAVVASVAAMLILTAISGRQADAASRLQSFGVFPFTVVSDAEDQEWLAFGAQSMLAGSLDNWREIRVVGPRRLRLAADLDGNELGARTALPDALALSAEAGAGTLVLGDIVVQAGAVEIVVRLYDVAGGRELRDPIRVTGSQVGDFRPLFDEIAVAILSLSGTSGVVPDLRSATTTSLTAYRHYLDGLERFRATDLNAAVDDFEAAVAQDSTFALGLFYLAQALDGRDEYGIDIRRRARQLMGQALRHSARLSWRDRQHLIAYNAHLDRAPGIARELYKELLEADSLDRDAWYHLGEVEYHDDMAEYGEDGSLRPRTNWDVAIASFLRSVELDPGFHIGYGHAIELLGYPNTRHFFGFVHPEDLMAWRGPESVDNLVYFKPAYVDSVVWVRVHPGNVPDYVAGLDQYRNDSIRSMLKGRAISIARRFAASSSGTHLPYWELANLYLEAEEFSLALGAAKDMIVQYADTVGIHRFILASIYLGADMPDTATAVADRALELYMEAQPRPSAPPPAYAANVFTAAGQPSRAIGDVLSLQEILPGRSWFPTADGGIDKYRFWRLFYTVQALGSSGAGGLPLRAAVDSLSEQWAANHPAGELDRLYVIGTRQLGHALSLLTDDRLDDWLSHLPDSLGPAERVASNALRALGHVRASRTDLANVALDSAIVSREYRNGDWDGTVAYMWGMVAQQLGRHQLAVELFLGIEDSRDHDEFFRASPVWGLLSLSYLHRATSYEHLGDRRNAAKYYGMFVRAWQDAEPSVRHYLEEAEAGLRRVGAG